MRSSDVNPEAWAVALKATRKNRPVVYAITNFVAASFQANAILAVGASPVMSPCLYEAEALAETCEGILVNTGTPSEEREKLVRRALVKAGESGKKTLLDPVGYGVSPFRRELVDNLLRDFRFSVIKGNYGEISLLAGEEGGIRGMESTETSSSVFHAVRKLAARTGSLVCATGEIDVLSDGDAVFSVRGGSAWLGRITGGGCVTGALMTALAAGSGSVLAGVFCGSVLLRRAAERAERESSGPGTFQANLLDALCEAQGEDLLSEGWRVEEVPE